MQASMKIGRIGSIVAACLVGAGLIAAGPKDGDHAKAKVGHAAPDFTLVDTDGKEHTLSDYTEQGKVVVLEWFNPGCPFVKKHYENGNSTMNTLAKDYADKGVVWIRVNSGAPGKQGAGVETNAQHKKDWKMTGPILLDETGKVGRMYGAKRTPEMYIISEEGVLAYHGAIDNDRSAKSIGEVNHVKQALDQHIAGETISVTTTEAYGCSVKYGAAG